MAKRTEQTEKRAKIRLLLGLEKKTQQEMRDALEKAYNLSADSIAENGYLSDQAGYYAALKFEAILRRHYRRVESVFARRALVVFAEMIGARPAKKSAQREDRVTVKPPAKYTNAFDEYIDLVALTKAKMIAETTLNDIRDIIRDQQQEGASYAEMARDIREVAPAISSYRAATIAITETHSAAMFAENTMTSALSEEYNVRTVKSWISAEDGRTRPAHSAANGQTIEMADKYKVGGEMLEFPGDPRGSAANTVRCRCVQRYKIIEDEAPLPTTR